VCSKGGRVLTFFEPANHGRAQDPEDAGQTAQGSTLLVSGQNLRPGSLVVSGTAWILAAGATAGVAQIALLTVASVAMSNQLCAAAVAAFQCVCHHTFSLP
jgi:hypothetical protein